MQAIEKKCEELNNFAWSLTDGKWATDEEFNDRNDIREVVFLLRAGKKINSYLLKVLEKYGLNTVHDFLSQ